MSSLDRYEGGVNVRSLTDALVWMGCSTGGQEEMAANLPTYINRLSAAVLHHKEAFVEMNASKVKPPNEDDV